MNAADLNRIRANPVFQELERKRNAFSWTLFVVMILIYGGFIAVVAFSPATLAQQIGTGPFTLAFPIGLGVIAAAIILTAVYVVRANSEFDRLTRQIVGQSDSYSRQAGAPLVAGAVR